jgi:allantoin racemase
MRRRRILIVNPNSSPLVTEILAREARRLVGEAAEIDAVTAPFGSASLECRAELVIAAHAVLQAIADASDFDAAVIGAFGDPGLEAAREITAAPVFGLGRSGLAAAGAEGRRFAIVTLGERMAGEIENMIDARGWRRQCVAIRFLAGTVLDVSRERAQFMEAMAAAARDCVRETGTEAVLFGGAPFAGAARELAGRLAIPVFDGLASAIEDAMRAPMRGTAVPAPKAGNVEKASVGVAEPLATRIHAFLSRRD